VTDAAFSREPTSAGSRSPSALGAGRALTSLVQSLSTRGRLCIGVHRLECSLIKQSVLLTSGGSYDREAVRSHVVLTDTTHWPRLAYRRRRIGANTCRRYSSLTPH